MRSARAYQVLRILVFSGRIKAAMRRLCTASGRPSASWRGLRLTLATAGINAHRILRFASIGWIAKSWASFHLPPPTADSLIGALVPMAGPPDPGGRSAPMPQAPLMERAAKWMRKASLGDPIAHYVRAVVLGRLQGLLDRMYRHGHAKGVRQGACGA